MLNATKISLAPCGRLYPAVLFVVLLLRLERKVNFSVDSSDCRVLLKLQPTPEPTNKNSHEVSRYIHRGVLNQLVGSAGTWSNVCPPVQISSVPFQARKVLDARPTDAGWVTRFRQTGHRCLWSNRTHLMPSKQIEKDETNCMYCDAAE